MPNRSDNTFNRLSSVHMACWTWEVSAGTDFIATLPRDDGAPLPSEALGSHFVLSPFAGIAHWVKVSALGQQFITINEGRQIRHI